MDTVLSRMYLKKGALAVLSEEPLENPAGPYIQVASSEQALKDIAEFYRSTLSSKIIGITGSVGKTSTKEMISAVLSQKYKRCSKQKETLIMRSVFL